METVMFWQFSRLVSSSIIIPVLILHLKSYKKQFSNFLHRRASCSLNFSIENISSTIVILLQLLLHQNSWIKLLNFKIIILIIHICGGLLLNRWFDSGALEKDASERYRTEALEDWTGALLHQSTFL